MLGSDSGAGCCDWFRQESFTRISQVWVRPRKELRGVSMKKVNYIHLVDREEAYTSQLLKFFHVG